MLAIQVILFGHLIWLGLYLLNRGTEANNLRPFGVFSLGLAAVAGLLAAAAPVRPEWDLNAELIPIVTILLGTFIYMLTNGFIVRERENDSVALARVIGILALLGGFALAMISIVLEPAWLQVSTPALVVATIILLSGGLLAIRRESIANGESFVPDIARSYDYSLLISAIFGGQVVLAMSTGPGATGPMTMLLLGTITAAIAIQVYLDSVQSILDQIAFANVSWLRQERAELRKVENLLPRVNMTDPLTIPEDEFSKLTRRALSNYGDLTKLATSPLTNLPEVHRRLAARRVEPSTLERARELKVVLAEAIDRLKPHSDDVIGTTDEWRFYNALYYPYIVRMRPYSTTAIHDFDEPRFREVLDWFRTYVPERTLYNWQNAAAALVAGDLREQEEIAHSPKSVASQELSPVS